MAVDALTATIVLASVIAYGPHATPEKRRRRAALRYGFIGLFFMIAAWSPQAYQVVRHGRLGSSPGLDEYDYITWRRRPHALDRTKVAALIENRAHAMSPSVISWWLQALPRDWPVSLWVGEELEALLLQVRRVRDNMATGRLTINVLPVEIANNIHDQATFSAFLEEPWFWEQFGEAVDMFNFQTDGVMCSGSPTALDDWRGYTWVGAPVGWSRDNYRVGGNGGLSMRRIPDMIEVARTALDKNDKYEDHWFVDNAVKILGDRAAWPLDRDQHDFSGTLVGEARPQEQRPTPLLVHGDIGDLSHFEMVCPEIEIIKLWNWHVKHQPSDTQHAV